MTVTASNVRRLRTGAVLLSLVAALLPFSSQVTQAVGPDVFINEIHYDNVSTDVGEAVEIAGPAGTDLTGWSVVMYNGSGGAVYGTIALSGTISDQQLGYGTVSFAAPGLQNGAPDGLALVDSGSEVKQFLSYEGTFAATNGPANGMTSADIGVSENGSGPIGESLQLVGVGTQGGDFSWAASQANTFGAINTGQTFGAAPSAPVVVINEVDYDQLGTDTAEFVELKNTGTIPVDLSGWSLELVNGTGGGASVYDTITLIGTLAVGDHYVVCGNAATVANCDLNAGTPTDFVQNGAPDAVGLRNPASALVDAVSYEGNTGAPYTEGSGAGLVDSGNNSAEGISRCPDGADTDQNSVDFLGGRPITPGASNSCPGGAPTDPAEICGASATRIHTIQGSGAASGDVNSIREIEGVVVGDFQGSASLNGFYVQEEDADIDGDPLTSEGIFVFDPANTVALAVGDVVRVRGTVVEFSGMTEINDVATVLHCNTTGVASAATVPLPVSTLDDFEAVEGMSVTFPQDLVISEYFNFDRFGEIVLTSERHLTPTAEFEPGPAATAAASAIVLDRITLDDGRTNQNPDPAIHPNGSVFDLSNLFRGGDTVTDVTGVMDYRFGLYRVQPTQGADYASVNARTASPDPVGGDLTVSSFNVLNYFTTFDTGAAICGPAGNQDCRGANNQDEFTRQRDKIIAAMVAIDADVFGLMEIENNVNDDAVINLVDGLNDATAPGTYASISTGAVGTDAIKVAMLYKPATVSPVGSYAILDSSVDSRFNDTKSRPVLAQSFADNSTGAIVTVAVNHLKSKGSSCADVGDPDLGDGAGNCNLTRTAAAEALVDWAATDPTGSGDSDFLIIGDLNSYDKEDPIDAIREGADDTLGTGDDFTDLVFQFLGEDAYSYVFDGQIGYLDHALANAGLVDQVSGVTVWHINADEPDLIDYDTSFKQPAQDALYAPDPYRSSDHDPVIVGLDLNAPPVCVAAVASETSLWSPNHKYVDIEVLGVTDAEGDDVTITITGIFQDEAVDAPGSGDTSPDGQGVGTATAQVRSERVGGGNGRVYHISFTASDGRASCSGEVTVGVPASRKGVAVDDGALFDSTVDLN